MNWPPSKPKGNTPVNTYFSLNPFILEQRSATIVDVRLVDPITSSIK
jgi:hypothetical protein